MAQALATASEEMLQQRDPSLLILSDETELYLIDRRFSTTTYGDISGNIICKLVYPDSTIPKLLESVNLYHLLGFMNMMMIMMEKQNGYNLIFLTHFIIL